MAQKIAGYPAPGLDVIFNQWQRISGGSLFPTPQSIVSDADHMYCFTGLDSSGNWKNGKDATGKTINPGTYDGCINYAPLAAASWSYQQNPGRLRNAANGGNFNGFISAVKYNHYTNEAVLTSTDIDDDAIEVIIAAVIDNSGAIYTLSAARTQGGLSPVKGFGIVYRKNNAVQKVFGERSVGATNCYNGPADCVKGDGKGWNGRMSKVRVERTGDMVQASASVWGLSDTNLALDAGSAITLDLADPANGLEIFKGAQYYGYGTLSQRGAEFRDVVFNSFADVEYVYDLLNDLTYKANSSGGYSLLPGVKAFDQLGYPMIVDNPETQKEFRLNADRTFDKLK